MDRTRKIVKLDQYEAQKIRFALREFAKNHPREFESCGQLERVIDQFYKWEEE